MEIEVFQGFIQENPKQFHPSHFIPILQVMISNFCFFFLSVWVVLSLVIINMATNSALKSSIVILVK